MNHAMYLSRFKISSIALHIFAHISEVEDRSLQPRNVI